MIRVELPAHLRTLAKVNGEVTLNIEGQVTTASVLDALEARYPTLQGTIRDHQTKKRRAFVRFFACMEDLSHDPADKRRCVTNERVARGHYRNSDGVGFCLGPCEEEKQ